MLSLSTLNIALIFASLAAARYQLILRAGQDQLKFPDMIFHRDKA